MKKGKEKKQGFSDGYISFTPEQMREQAAQDAPNAEAYEWLDKAMTTSSNVSMKDKKGDTVEVDDIYPVTAEETEQMRQCLNEAERVATNPNEPSFRARLGELRSIIEWSSKRHYTYSKGLIIGVLIIVALVIFMKSSASDGVEHAQTNCAMVDKWQPVKDTTIAYETISKADVARRYQDAIKYKHYILHRTKERAESAKGSALKYTQYADTASISKAKKSYLQSAKECEESYEENVELYQELNEMNYKDIYKYAKSEVKSHLSSARSSNRVAFIWSAIFVLLIPAYIVSQRPYGYMITRMRFESKIVGGIQKFFFAIAGGMASLSMLVPDAPVTVTKWSDGTKTREQNGALSAMLMAVKFMLLITALCIFCGVSFLLMVYLTVQGLRRNYNWTAVKAQAQEYVDKGKSKLESN